MSDIDKRLEDIECRWRDMGEMDFEDYSWMINTLKSECEEKERLEKKAEILEELIKQWNDHSKNGTEKEKNEFFHVFYRVFVEKHMDQKEALGGDRDD